MIDEEINAARQGMPGYIGVKINSLTDKVIIDRLIAASQAGVKIDLIVRGICCLLPGVLLLLYLMDQYGAQTVTVSHYGVREGYLHQKIQPALPDNS